MPKKRNKLFVATADDTLLFFMAHSLWDALVINKGARVPNPEEMSVFVADNKVAERSMSDVGRQFGVTKQTVLNWRRKAGIPKEEQPERRRAIVEAAVACGEIDPAAIRKISEQFGVSPSTVERYCRLAEVKRKKIVSRRRPSDKELVTLAMNKTWPEFANAAGLSINYLRAYVYARPELARAVRVMLVRNAPKKAE